jgi:type IV secretory pathway VirB10-like protein
MKYSRTLDFVLACLREAKAGKMENAAALFERALRQSDFDATVASLETKQVAAFDELSEKKPSIKALFEALAAKKAKKKVKAKPFGGKKAPPFKKKEKADLGLDEIDPVLDEMTADEELDLEGDDLDLTDLEGLDGEGVDEMPEASPTEAAEDEDKDSEEESSEDDDKDSEEESSEGEDKDSEEESSDEGDDEKKDSEEESTPAVTASKMKVLAGNLAALDRLAKAVKAGPAGKKPAGK